jgi:hypothetical protein
MTVDGSFVKVKRVADGAAMQQFARASWDAGDVNLLSGEPIENCLQWLCSHQDKLHNEVVVHGWRTLSTLLRDTGFYVPDGNSQIDPHLEAPVPVRYACSWLTPEQIQGMAPGRSIEECRAWLADHHRNIKEHADHLLCELAETEMINSEFIGLSDMLDASMEGQARGD